MLDEKLGQIAREAEIVSHPNYQRREEFDISDKLKAIEDRKRRMEREAAQNEFTLGRQPEKIDVANAAIKGQQ